MAASHLGAGSGFIDEHQSAWVEVELAFEPGRTPLYDVWSGLFVRVRRLFLSVTLWRSKNRQSVPIPTKMPRSAKAALSSARVTSGLASTKPRIRAEWASMRLERRSPPKGPGRTSPCRRAKLLQRMALEALTPKRTAAWRHDIPSSIAATTRSRKSTDSALLMHASLHHRHAV
jgi:hypothetical protein